VIVADFTEKGTFAQMEMRARFLDLKCPDHGNVQEFLDSLCTKQEELAMMGVDVDKKDYRSTIILSLPIPLANFASNQLATAKLYSASKTTDPDSLITLISEEYDHQQSQHAAHKRQKKEEKDTKDEALAVSSGSGSNQDKKGRLKRKRECWNCGEVGHFKDKCTKPKKEKASNTANAAVSESEEEVAFFFVEEDEEEDS